MVDSLLALLVGLFMASLAISSYRLIMGPTIPDRVLALDIVSYGLAVIMALLAVIVGSPYLIVISFSLALWFFIGSIYIARYLEGKQIGD
jgi:multicomponent Na+:H+ antiporter subunit F